MPDMEPKKNHTFGLTVFILIALVACGVGYYTKPTASHSQGVPTGSIVDSPEAVPQQEVAGEQVQSDSAPLPLPLPDTHISTPSTVTAVYISSWSAGTTSSMNHIYRLLNGGKLTAVVIDIKDATGRLSYMPHDPELLASGVGTKRIANLAALIKTLHDKGIYVIGRVAVFQDPFYASLHPDAALHDTSGAIWHDTKGIAWLRTDNSDVWHYTERIAEDAYAQGFDEINVDYVRFPSDGNLSAIDERGFTQSKQDTVAGFFTDLDTRLRGQDHIPLSADIFGLTLSADDDMGIGQKLELIAPHVDYVCPMIYPSHFANGAYGYKNPAEHPYQIIHKSLSDGIAKLKAIDLPSSKLRPWLQDFNLGALYTADMVQDQITATNDVGLDSWLMWDPRNVYTASVFD